LLNEIGITINKNAIPFDPLPPSKCSGIRLGSAALTTRGLKEAEYAKIGEWISKILKNPRDSVIINAVKEEISALLAQFPLY
jgi:glycine hydroxymethyltransferase